MTQRLKVMDKIMRLKIWLFGLILFAVTRPDYAAVSGSISGVVVDTKTKLPLPGANIVVEGSLYGGSSGADGVYLINHLPPGIYVLRASMMGYKNQTQGDIRVQVNRTTSVDFSLEETFIEMDPIVVIAGKTEQRLDQANVSISVVTARDIERRNAIDIKEALETTPGVNFIGDQLNIRGSTGFTFGIGNKVLLLLDGVPVYASDTGQFNWDMLPPLDIEQIEVLKGAGSTLWGASALGGVVNIITKEPTEQGQFLYSFSTGKHDWPYFSEWNWTNHSRLWYNREDVSYSKRFEKFGLRLSAGRYETTGYQQLGDSRKYNLTSKIDYRFGNGIRWTGYAAYSYIDKGFFVQWKGQNDPYEVDPTNLDNYARTNQLNTYMKLAVPISSKFGMNFRASFIRTLVGNEFGSDADFNPAIGQGVEGQA
ncbi:MAG: TonB-dependent receptor, partial [Calditrichaeota bacterium]